MKFSMKKMAVAALAVGSFIAQAEAPEGVYGGLRVGVRSDDDKLFFYDGALDQHYDLGTVAPVAGVSVGYQEHFYESNWLWGVEISADYGREKADYYWAGAVGTRYAFEKTWDFTSVLKLGYDAGSLTPYVFGGVSYARFKSQIQLAANTAAHIQRGFKPGFVFGAGATKTICSGQELDLSYAYKRYGRYRTQPFTVASPANKYSTRFRSHEFFLTYKVFFDKDSNGHMESVEFDPTGVVFGFGGGYQSLNTKMNHNYGAFAASPVSLKAQGSSPLANVLMGYQFACDKYVFGVDLTGAYSFMGIKSQNYQDASSRSIRQTWDGRALARFGYQFGAGVIPYATVGLGLARFKANVNNLPAGEALYGSSRKWRSGVILGAGVQLPIEEDASVDISYTYARYKKLSFSAPNAVAPVPPDPAAITNSDYKPRTHQFMVSYRVTF